MKIGSDGRGDGYYALVEEGDGFHDARLVAQKSAGDGSYEYGDREGCGYGAGTIGTRSGDGNG